jgi:TetR/AcrR family transcriptional regulator, transcriptional repressor for nem operon
MNAATAMTARYWKDLNMQLILLVWMKARYRSGGWEIQFGTDWYNTQGREFWTKQFRMLYCRGQDGDQRMGRPRSFDTDIAIEKAMQVFWKHGYEGASLPDLLEGMGLTRGSLYKAFTDKKTLFLKVLEHYEGKAIQSGVALLTDRAIPNGADRIMAMFTNAFRAVTDGDDRGCLLCTTAAGPSAYDDEIAAAVSQGFDALREGIVQALMVSPKHAQMNADERGALADMLIAQYVGLRTMARARVDHETLRNAVRSVGVMLA